VVSERATSARRKVIREVDEVNAASSAPLFIASRISLDGMLTTVAPASCRIRSISCEPPRAFKPCTCSGRRIGSAPREATPPACQIQLITTRPWLSKMRINSLPTSAFFQA